MLAAELNLSAAFTALAIGGILLAVVWVLDRRALRRELEVDEEYEAVELLHDELLHDELRHDQVGLLTPHIDDTPSNVRVIGRVDRAEPAPASAPREPVIAAPVATAEHAVIVASAVEATPVIEPEPIIELVDEPVVEPEPVREPAPARSKMPKGADAVLAALADVIPEMGATTVAVQAPAEPAAQPTPRDTVESLAEFFETPAEPSGAELMARQRARRSTPTNR